MADRTKDTGGSRSKPKKAPAKTATSRSAKSKSSAKIKVSKASAEEIRSSLGITPSETRVALRAIHKVSRATKSISTVKRDKEDASRRALRNRRASKSR